MNFHAIMWKTLNLFAAMEQLSVFMLCTVFFYTSSCKGFHTLLELAWQNTPCLKMTRTLKCLSIGTPKNNKFSICLKWKIHYFQVSQNLGRVQPRYNVLDYWDT